MGFMFELLDESVMSVDELGDKYLNNVIFSIHDKKGLS
jgi:hypothetical protein